MELFFNPSTKVTAKTNNQAAPPLHKAVAQVDPSIWIVGAALIALTVKLAIAFNTLGTNDVAAFYVYARSLHDHGLESTYRNAAPWSSGLFIFNHPPLFAYFLQAIDSLSRNEIARSYGLTFPFLLRLPGIVADFVTVLVVLRISQIKSQFGLPIWALVLFALSPVSLMVSGFHGNTDPVMVMFLVIATYLLLVEKPALCGIFFALSCQVKIIPLLLLPIFFFFWFERKAAMRFVLPFALLTVLMWIQPLIGFPVLFAKNVIAYGSYWGGWGITYWLQLTRWEQFNAIGFTNQPLAATILASVLKAGIVCVAFAIGWRRRCLGTIGTVPSIAYVWLAFFIFTPGFCSYYLVWLAPFILLFSPVFYGWLTTASSAFLFFFYNGLAGGLPWFTAMSKFTNPERLTYLTPWSVWPWATLICGAILFWKKSTAADSSLRLFSLNTLTPDGR